MRTPIHGFRSRCASKVDPGQGELERGPLFFSTPFSRRRRHRYYSDVCCAPSSLKTNLEAAAQSKSCICGIIHNLAKFAFEIDAVNICAAPIWTNALSWFSSARQRKRFRSRHCPEMKSKSKGADIERKLQFLYVCSASHRSDALGCEQYDASIPRWFSSGGRAVS